MSLSRELPTSMKRSLLVIGASSVALNVLDLAHELSRSVEVFVDETVAAGAQLRGTDFQVANTLEPWIDDDRLDVVIAIGDNFWRENVYNRLRHRVRPERFINLVHPRATVSSYARLGIGSLLLANSTIGPYATIGDFAYLNVNTVVAHDCALGSFVSMSPGAALAGRVRVGARSSVGMNASVREGRAVSEDVIVGANSFVNSDAPSSCVLVGAPARVLRERVSGERYLR